MKIFFDKDKLIKTIQNEKKIGFVPTMGAIHSGHESLIKKSLMQCNKTIVSIYVNKPQFNKILDFRNYPKKNKSDILKLKSLKVDFLYFPSTEQIYPTGTNKKIKIDLFKKKLCGEFRPGHFEAVADVIDRFIKIIEPNVIYFGEKDMQQLKILEDYINKNHKKVKVVGCKTIRENNGIAKSSRNILLSSKERKIASKVYKLILNKKKELFNKKLPLKKIKKIILNFGVYKIDYIKLLNINKLIKPYKKKKRLKVFIAYYLGSTRLIDNI